jgi:hypothetical protein
VDGAQRTSFLDYLGGASFYCELGDAKCGSLLEERLMPDSYVSMRLGVLLGRCRELTSL